MATVQTGYEQTLQGLTITKDTEAQLIYTLDWSEWLTAGDELTSIEYEITARANDPRPLIRVDSGRVGNKTWIELKEGQVKKTYTVTAKITTLNGYVDRRHFRVRVEDRSA